MLQLQIQTSTSKMIPISDLRYLYELARCSKCTMFILLKSTNKLYGTTEDCTSIHEIDIPYLVNTDLMFRLDQFDSTKIYQDESEYFIPNEFNWVILPSYYWDMYISGDIESCYDPNLDQYVLYDKTIKQPIQDQIQMYKYRDSSDFVRFDFMKQLEGFLLRKRTLGNPEIFTNMQDDENIKKVFENKVSIGRVLCRAKNENIDVLFYLYKSLFSLAKNDTLDLEIRFDRYQTSTFMITFKPKKKKNPLKFNTYGVPFSEKIHCMFINMQ